MGKPTYSIVVDRDVFEFLQKHAMPLVDSPNDVLRRLLLGDLGSGTRKEELPMSTATIGPPHSVGSVSAEGFVEVVLRERFGTDFRRVSPYRMMFESSKVLVYFQNFNKETDHLWYRITENPWRVLTSSKKEAWVCLTNPAERFAYIIPVEAIQSCVMRTRWSRTFLEINIDPASSRWTEFDWRIEKYLAHF
jgi:hypothetical protein